MNLPQAFGILLLGVGSGALLTWLQQATVRRRFRQEIVAQIDKTLFDESRRQRFLNLKENVLKPARRPVLYHRRSSRPLMPHAAVDRTGRVSLSPESGPQDLPFSKGLSLQSLGTGRLACASPLYISREQRNSSQFPRDDPHIQLALEWVALPAECKDEHEGLAAN
jgi:hypothetical protein